MSDSGQPSGQRKLQPTRLDLSDRCAVLTGAASGMALSVAEGLSAAGVRLVLGDLDEVGLARTTEQLRAQGATLCSESTDVTRSEDVQRLMARAQEQYGGVDILINLAAIIDEAPVLEADPTRLEQILSVNVTGTFNACQAAARHMVDRGSGCIINLTSVGAFKALPHLSAYSMSKAAVVALTRTLAIELGPRGVRVNAVAPGFIEGGMTLRHLHREDGSIDEEGREQLLARIRQKNPLRLTGVPEDVSEVVLFLASESARYITGQVIHTNGGAYMP